MHEQLDFGIRKDHRNRIMHENVKERNGWISNTLPIGILENAHLAKRRTHAIIPPAFSFYNILVTGMPMVLNAWNRKM